MCTVCSNRIGEGVTQKEGTVAIDYLRPSPTNVTSTSGSTATRKEDPRFSTIRGELGSTQASKAYPHATSEPLLKIKTTVRSYSEQPTSSREARGGTSTTDVFNHHSANPSRQNKNSHSLHTHLSSVPVVSDELVQSIGVGDPSHHARVVAQRGHRVPLDRQVVAVVSPVLLKQRVDLLQENKKEEVPTGKGS